MVGKIRKFMANWKFLCRYVWDINKRAYPAAAITILLDVVEPFAVLVFPKFIIDELTGEKRWETVLGYLSLLIGILVVLRLLRLGAQVFCNMAVNGGDVLNVKHYTRFFLDMDYARLEDEHVRDLQGTIMGKVHVNNAAETLRGVITSLLRLAGYAYLVFMLHPLVLLAVALVTAVNYGLGLKREKCSYVFAPEQARAARKFDYCFETMADFSYAKEVRINQASAWLAGKFSQVLDAYRGKLRKHENRMLLLAILEAAVGFVQMSAMYGYAVHRAILGEITIGDFSVFAGACLSLSAAFGGLVGGMTNMLYLSKYVDDYKKYTELAKPSHLKKGQAAIPDKEAGNVGNRQFLIEFRDVSFRYPGTDRNVLDHVSLAIGDREKLAVVGVNGAGKTTFIKLLCRLYEPTEGVILYNGTDISEIRYDEYVRLLSVVFQDFRLLAFTMEENVVLNQSSDRGKVLEAIRKSGLEDKLERLPKGLDTNVGKDFDEEGVEFSGGEGQKLVTARAYYKDAPIVVLDEPTSALDPISENAVYQRFHEIMEDKTAIFISHRLASTRFCDRVAVFAGGKVVECGTHEQLMEQEGLYRQMFLKQAEYYKSS
nr:ABC transporter ATP-binding protein [uncultured Acetatifactor sp.]